MNNNLYYYSKLSLNRAKIFFRSNLCKTFTASSLLNENNETNNLNNETNNLNNENNDLNIKYPLLVAKQYDFIMLFTAKNSITKNKDNDFVDYVKNNLKDSDIYIKKTEFVFLKMKRIGNIKNILKKTYKYNLLNNKINFKYLQCKKFNKIIDNIYYLMNQNNLYFDFNIFEYNLYEVNNEPDLFIIKIKINNKLETSNLEKDKIEISNLEKNDIEKIMKTMYIFHSYKKMFYYCVK